MHFKSRRSIFRVLGLSKNNVVCPHLVCFVSLCYFEGHYFINKPNS